MSRDSAAPRGPAPITRAVCLGALVAVPAIFLSTATTSANELSSTTRAWTDASGDFTVTAKLIEFNAESQSVRLQKSDGRVVTLPLDRLSKADREYLLALKAPAEDADNPFAGGKPSGALEPAERIAKLHELISKTLHGPENTADYLKAPEIAVGQSPLLEGLEIAPAERATHFEPKTIPLRGKGDDFFERTLAMAAAPGDAGIAVIAHANTTGFRGRDRSARLEICDLNAAKAFPSEDLDEIMLPIAFSPSGKKLVTKTPGDLGARTAARLDIWSVDGPHLQRIACWSPFAKPGFGSADIMWADWVDDEHLVTVGGGTNLVLWDVTDFSPIYRMRLNAFCKPCLSHDREVLFAPTGSGIEAFEALTGKPIGRVSEDVLTMSALALSPNGKRLAEFGSRRLRVWDLADGGEPRAIPAPATVHVPGCRLPVAWLDDTHVLLAGGGCIDVDRRIPIWTYGFDADAACMLDGWLWSVAPSEDRRGQALVPLRLPHEQAAAAASKLVEKDAFVVRPGASVTIDVSELAAEEDERDAVKDALAEKLEAADIRVKNKAPVRLVARTEALDKKEVEYRRIGRPGTDTVKISPFKFELFFEVDGKRAWESTTTYSSPPILHLEKDESVKKAVKRYETPSMRFFKESWLPSHVIDPNVRERFGKSSVTSAGLK